MNAPLPMKKLLLLEPDSMIRQTVALTARSTGLAEVQDASSLKSAHELLHQRAYDGFLLALDNDDGAMDLIEQLRSGKTPSASSSTIAVLLGHCNAETVKRLGLIGVDQIILRPFKVKTLLGAIQRFTA